MQETVIFNNILKEPAFNVIMGVIIYHVKTIGQSLFRYNIPNI